jgi:SAM-dependent methyltransferase
VEKEMMMSIPEIIERYNKPHEFEKRNLALYRQLSGYDLAKEVEGTNPELVIDFGCGSNIFKEHINRLIGIDITPHHNVDIIDDLHNAGKYFKENSANWIFNFGPLQYIDPHAQTELMCKLLKPGGTIVAHSNVKAPWSIDYVDKLGKEYGLTLTNIEISYTDTSKMTKKDLVIQKEVAKWSEFDMEILVAPRLTWRWSK